MLSKDEFKTRVRELGLGTVRIGESSQWAHSDVLFAHDEEQRGHLAQMKLRLDAIAKVSADLLAILGEPDGPGKEAE